MTEYESVLFSAEQQAGIIGYALTHPEIWRRIDAVGFDHEWVSDPRLVALVNRVEGFRTAHKRPPNPDELVQYVRNVDHANSQNVEQHVAWARRHADSLQPDILLRKLVQWAEGRTVVGILTKVQAHYNANEYDQGRDAYLEGVGTLRRLQADVGGDHMRSSADLFDEEETERLEDSKHLVTFGVTFLDDYVLGIPRSDLLLVGAREGVGKSQFAKIVTRNVARSGKRVDAFYLEASKFEMERRTKFEMLSSAYRAHYPGIDMGGITFRAFMAGQLEAKFAPFKAKVSQEYREGDGKYLHTYYRSRDNFSPSTLEAEVTAAVAAGTELVVVDHLHYLDLEDDREENIGYFRAIKSIRALTLRLKVPILCVVHLNKTASAAVVPDTNHIHGTGNISKVSTTQVMIARAGNFAVSDPRVPVRGRPTFMRVTKDRMGGADSYVALTWFDPVSGRYSDVYALGRLSFDGSKWIPLKGDFPYWAEHGGHLIRDISTPLKA